MSFRYFAYGSNLWLPQMRSRCPSARPIGSGSIEGWRIHYDKPSTDGSAKLNIRPDPGSITFGVVYEIDDEERPVLDAAEPRYTPIEVSVLGQDALTYTYEGEPHPGGPYDWYVATNLAGAAFHGIPSQPFDVPSEPDPLASGIRPATDDLELIQSILSRGLQTGGDRYYVHPGDYAWWVHHDDPRYPDHLSTWIQGDSGFVVVDSRAPTEINVFTSPGVDRMPLVRWAQRRLDGRGEIGWVADSDRELADALAEEGYRPVAENHLYEWELSEEPPSPDLPDGWKLRRLEGEHEADNRRRASHAAFESTMPDAMHLQRYLGFMRSPVYVPDRDLVAVDPSGRIASFMVWWADHASGFAQIEPFGTHPDFQRQGIGRALIYFGLHQMKDAGMRLCRVATDDWRAATGFYEGVGFADVGRLRWWRPPS